MNSIMMIVGAVIVILIVFIIFSQDDLEEEPDMNPEEKPETAISESSGSHQDMEDRTNVPLVNEFSPDRVPRSPTFEEEKIPLEVGREEDLKFRLLLDDQLPPPTHSLQENTVALVVQLRFPEQILLDGVNFIQMLKVNEDLFESDRAPFPFSVFLGNQNDRLLLFGFEEERDDAVFESLVTAYDLISRFKKLLEKSERLLQAKVRMAIGISLGSVIRIHRGPVGPVSHAGKAVYLAETLAEAAGDFQIYVDQEIHRLALPLFDFREWKPMKLRPPLPLIAIFEVVGWNKKDEIFAFVNHSESYSRRAVAVVYRYLDFTDLAPLLGLLSDNDERVALETLKTIAEIKDERALSILKKMLPVAKNSLLRSSIIEALGQICKTDIVPVLLASTKDVSWQVRLNAAKSLFKVAGAEAIKHIEHMTKDDDGAVRAVIHKILFERFQQEKDLIALKDLLTDLSQRARKAAIEALIEIETPTSIIIASKSYPDQEIDLKRFILHQLVRAKSNVLYQAFLNIFYASDEKDRPEIVAAVRRARLMA